MQWAPQGGNITFKDIVQLSHTGVIVWATEAARRQGDKLQLWQIFRDQPAC